MAGFYERRKSVAAIWCFRLAIIAVPFFILTIFLHRSSGITTQQAFWLISVGIGLLLASLVFGLKAATDLWEKGYKGGRATVNGIVLSILLLIPFGIQLFNALENPQLNDVSTDVVNPPEFLAPVDSDTGEISISDIYDDYQSREIISNYPELVTRRYDAPQERVTVSVREILDRWGWKIQSSVNLPKIPQPNEDDKVDNSAEEKLAGDESELAASAEDTQNELMPDITIQVQAHSFILKLPSYLVIRLSQSDNATLVDIRSTSLWGRHDFGSNAKNISQFLDALDAALAGVAGEV